MTTLTVGVLIGGKLCAGTGVLRHVLRLRFPVDRPRPADLGVAGLVASGQDTCPGSAQATRTAIVGETGHPSPSRCTSGSAQRSLLSTTAAATTSSSIELPFMATSAPVGDTSGIDQPSSRSNGATA